MKEFENLGLSQEMLKLLREEGFEKPSEIQEKSIPIVLKGKDIIGGSVTGSGKTLVFSVPIIENLKPNQRVQALILTPTRELTNQVSDSIKKFSKNKKLNVLAIYGGVNIEPQIRRLAFADVVVGTPGRILDHMKKRTLKLDSIKFLVLDEVDRMFDMGFHKDVEKIIKECPKERQTMMFSATISSELDHLAKKYTRNPIEISVKSYLDSSKLKQIYYDVKDNKKFSLLVHLLKKESSELVMVFCSTRKNADFVANNLDNIGINAKAIHGGLDQKKRSRILQEFHEKGVSVLVCTDVAARGLDIKGVSHVYNYDIPKTSNDYIHRIGRTARAGKDGIAINLLSSRDYENFGEVTKNSFLEIIPQELPRFEIIRHRTDFGRKTNFSQRDNRKPLRIGIAKNRGGDSRGRSFGNRDFGEPRRQGGDNIPRRDNYGNKFRDKDKHKRDNRSFGNKGNFRPRSSGRSFGSRDRKSSKNFNRTKPQRYDWKRQNTKEQSKGNFGKRR